MYRKAKGRKIIDDAAANAIANKKDSTAEGDSLMNTKSIISIEERNSDLTRPL